MVTIKVWTTRGPVNISVNDCGTLFEVASLLKLESGAFYFQKNGRLVSPSHSVQHEEIYHLLPCVLGGKGGFGSMLRAIGAQIEKTTSREACRDLSGRRMRDVNNEKKLKEWVAKQADRERDKERQRQEKRARLLAESQSQKLNDPSYTEQCARVQQDLEGAVAEGLKKVKSTSASSTCTSTREARKRKAEDADATSSKRKWEWIGVEVDSDDAGSEDDQVKPSVPDASLLGDMGQDLEGAMGTKHPAQSEDSSNPDEQKDHIAEDPQIQLQTDNITSCQQEDTSVVHHEVILDNFSSPEALEVLGPDRLKVELMARGLKCGGTLQERAHRLYSVKGLSSDQISPALLAKPSNARQTKK